MDNQFHTAAWFDDYADLKDDVVSRSEWDDLKDFRNFLRPFYTATKRLEGGSSSLDKALATTDYLIAHYKELKLIHSNNPILLERILVSLNFRDIFIFLGFGSINQMQIVVAQSFTCTTTCCRIVPETGLWSRPKRLELQKQSKSLLNAHEIRRVKSRSKRQRRRQRVVNLIYYKCFARMRAIEEQVLEILQEDELERDAPPIYVTHVL